MKMHGVTVRGLLAAVSKVKRLKGKGLTTIKFGQQLCDAFIASKVFNSFAGAIGILYACLSCDLFWC